MRRKIIEPKVRHLLEMFPFTRSDDHLLYFMYVTREIKDVVFATAFVNYSVYGLAPYHSIARVRRKIQQNTPALRGDVEMKLRQEIDYYNQYKGD